jgi:hypothetical protein
MPSEEGYRTVVGYDQRQCATDAANELGSGGVTRAAQLVRFDFLYISLTDAAGNNGGLGTFGVQARPETVNPQIPTENQRPIDARKTSDSCYVVCGFAT